MSVRRSRLISVAAVLASTLTLLTACTPGRQPLLALTLVNGLPTAIVHSCAPGLVEISVTENSPTPTTTPPVTTPGQTPTPTPTGKLSSGPTTPELESYAFTWAVKNDLAPIDAEVQLFSAPTGWTVQKDTLTSLRKGARYYADAQVTGIFDVSPVNFVLQDLLDLKPGEVLYGVNAPLTTVLTRADFDAKAKQACVDALPPSSTPT